MFLKEKIKKIFKQALSSDFTAQKLAQSFAIGLYIAFSPFPGAHTIMVLTAKWLFRLNLPIVFIASSLNNPWTIIPFFTGDYMFGHWLIHNVFHWHPTFIIPLAKIFGSGQICLCSFLIGGNILGICAAFLSYPFVKVVFRKLMARQALKAE